MATKKKEKKSKYVTRTLALPNGKRKYVYGKTAAEADAKLRELKAELDMGVNIDDDTTFGELAKTWLEKYKAPYVKESSLYTIRTMLNAHAMPALSNYRVKDITGPILRNWFNKVISSGYSRGAVLLSYIRSIFDVGVELGCIGKNPVPITLRAPSPRGPKQKEVLSFEMERLLLDQLLPFTPERMFFMLGRYTGLRRGEICALNWDSINLKTGVITVRRNLAVGEDGRSYFSLDTKTESGLRELPIPEILLAELQSWYDRFGTTATVGLKIPALLGSEGFLFCHAGGEPYTMQNLQTVWNRIRKLVREADQEYAKNFTPHILRHTYITRLFESGLDLKEIQFLAGHSDAQTTLGIYTHFDKQSRQTTTFDKVRGVISGQPMPKFKVL